MYIDLSKIFNKVKEEEGVHKIERISGINSTLMEEPHHVKMQTLYSGDDPSMHTEKYNIPDRDLGVNSILVDESHRVMTRETYSKDDLSIHMEEESSKLKINQNIPTSQRNIEGVRKAGRIPGSNMFKNEEIKAQRRRLYKAALETQSRVLTRTEC